MNKFYCIFLVLLFFSCSNEKGEGVIINIAPQFVENQLPYIGLFHGDIKDNEWIRIPENIQSVHESFKLGFYDKYLNTMIFQDELFIGGGLFYNGSLEMRLDSLIMTYPNYSNASKFYKEFWSRRNSENNDSTVYEILKEVRELYNGGEISIKSELVNDTLVNLIEFNIDKEVMTSQKALYQFNYLRSIGLHQSAYNLLYESSFYQDVELPRDELLKTLITLDSLESIESYGRKIFIIDNTK